MWNTWYLENIAPQWLLVAILAAGVLSFILYSKREVPWSKNITLLLGFLRLSAIALLIILFLDPLIQLDKREVEKPWLIFAIDNSSSVVARAEQAPSADAIREGVKHLTSELGLEYQISHEHLVPKIGDSLYFESKVSDLHGLLRSIHSQYDDEHVAGVVFISDGIFNQGMSPAYASYTFPVYTIGVGDTVVPKDVGIQNIRNNKVAYQGNRFPLVVSLYQKGYEGQSIEVSLFLGQKKLESKRIEPDLEGQVNVTFLVNAESQGFHKYRVRVTPMEGESSLHNNEMSTYVDIIKNKVRVLIMAPGPHPDIQAIKSSLDAVGGYDVTIYIPGVTKSPDRAGFDAIVEHQAFSGVKYGDYKSKGWFYIMGERSQLSLMSKDLNYLKISPVGNKKDDVTAAYNEKFSKFKIEAPSIARTQGYPPVQVMFGDYKLSGPSQVLLYQRVGSIETDKPLLSVYDDGNRKSAVMMASGLWQWRLHENAYHDGGNIIDELLQKIIQYLSIRENKKRFIVKPRELDYQVGDRVILDTEVYNDLYERTYGNVIEMVIEPDSGAAVNYEIRDSKINSSVNMGTMPAGAYRYTATTTLDGQKYKEEGSFAVKDIQLEGTNLVADHNLLKTVSENSGGQFFHLSGIDGLIDHFRVNAVKPVIKLKSEKLPLVNSLWVLGFVFLLLAVEWFLRRYLGAY